ncbi:unnamed protein product, partial [Didymodactylos carnosus]
FEGDVHMINNACTGTCAFRIRGFTHHSTLGLDKQLKKNYERLSSDKLTSYRTKVGSIKLKFDDEISLMNYNI